MPEVEMEVQQAGLSSALPVAQQRAAGRSAPANDSPAISADALAPVDQAEISTTARAMARAVMNKKPTLQLAPDQLRAMSTGHER